MGEPDMAVHVSNLSSLEAEARFAGNLRPVGVMELDYVLKGMVVVPRVFNLCTGESEAGS